MNGANVTLIILLAAVVVLVGGLWVIALRQEPQATAQSQMPDWVKDNIGVEGDTSIVLHGNTSEHELIWLLDHGYKYCGSAAVGITLAPIPILAKPAHWEIC